MESSKMAAIQENYSCSCRPDPGGGFCRLDVLAEVPISCVSVRRLDTDTGVRRHVAGSSCLWRH